VLWCALRVGDVFVVDENFRDCELWYRGHTALLLQFHRAAETASPIERIEETDNYVAANSFFDTLKAGTTPKELF
jgi:hypothetical protein